jgi:hypothetical protein
MEEAKENDKSAPGACYRAGECQFCQYLHTRGDARKNFSHTGVAHPIKSSSVLSEREQSNAVVPRLRHGRV